MEERVDLASLAGGQLREIGNKLVNYRENCELKLARKVIVRDYDPGTERNEEFCLITLRHKTKNIQIRIFPNGMPHLEHVIEIRAGGSLYFLETCIDPNLRDFLKEYETTAAEWLAKKDMKEREEFEAQAKEKRDQTFAQIMAIL